MSDEPRSLKDFWSDPDHNRRHSSGRRESDYSVCIFHGGQAERVREDVKKIWETLDHVEIKFKQIDEKIVGKFAFGLIVTVLLAVITLSSGMSAWMFQSIKSDIHISRKASE